MIAKEDDIGNEYFEQLYPEYYFIRCDEEQLSKFKKDVLKIQDGYKINFIGYATDDEVAVAKKMEAKCKIPKNLNKFKLGDTVIIINDVFKNSCGIVDNIKGSLLQIKTEDITVWVNSTACKKKRI